MLWAGELAESVLGDEKSEELRLIKRWLLVPFFKQVDCECVCVANWLACWTRWSAKRYESSESARSQTTEEEEEERDDGGDDDQFNVRPSAIISQQLLVFKARIHPSASGKSLATGQCRCNCEAAAVVALAVRPLSPNHRHRKPNCACSR